MERRNFIKKSCMVCLSGMAFNVFLESCGTSKVVQAPQLSSGHLQVPLAQFTDENNHVVVRSEKMDYDILIVKNKETYKALLLKCTHFANPIFASKTQINCNQHGSAFDMEGKVINGPASENLKTFPTEVSGEFVLVKI